MPPETATSTPVSARTTGLPSHLTQEENPPFWKPTWAERFRYLGWRNVLFLPAIATVIGIAAIFLLAPELIPMLLYGSKLIILLLAIPVGLAAKAVKMG